MFNKFYSVALAACLFRIHKRLRYSNEIKYLIIHFSTCEYYNIYYNICKITMILKALIIIFNCI